MKQDSLLNCVRIAGGMLFCAVIEIAHCQPSDTTLYRQTDLIDYVSQLLNVSKKSDVIREKRKTRFSIIPLAPSSAGGNHAVVSAINTAFYLGDPADTYLSNLYFYPFTNFSGRGGFISTGNLWANHNHWNVPLDLRLLRVQTNAYALGSNTNEDDHKEVDYDHFRSYITVHRLVIRKFYAGLGYNLDVFYKIRSEEELDFDIKPKSISSGITFNLLRDSRQNSINPKGGFYTSLIFRYNSKALGSSEDWNSLYFDGRKYFQLKGSRSSLLAFRSLYWGTYGNTTYLDLPGTFMELGGRAGRGYVTGRFRGKQMLYFEGEYRIQLSANGFWGMVLFANGQSFTEPDTDKFAYIVPAAGTGLRMKFNKKSDMNITLDFAVGRDGFNWYLNLGEFF